MKKIIISLAVISTIFLCGCHLSIEKIAEDLNKYEIDLTFDETTNTLKGCQTVYYTNRTQTTLDYVDFHLYPNAFREDAKYKPVSFSSEARAYPNGKSYGGIEIEKVQVDDVSKEINVGGEDKNILKVDTGEFFPDDQVKIYFEYTITLPNCNHRFGYGENTYNFGNFYPIACVYENGEFAQDTYSYNGDPFYSDMSCYDVSISINNDFVLASTGEQISKKSNDAITTYNISAKAVRDFAFVLSKKFKVLTKSYDNTLIYYYYFNDTSPQKSLQTAYDSLETFNNLFGEYPYKSLSVVESDFVHGGMEYPTLVYISTQVTDYEEYANVIIHEIAHQWWYGLVGNDEYNNAWQDEALAEMSTLLFYQENPQYNISFEGKKSILHSNYSMFLDVFNTVYGSVDQSMTRNLSEFKSETEYTYITYVRGNIMYCDLMDFVGKKKFVKALKKYYETNIYTNANPDALIDAFVSVCGKSSGDFLTAYLEGKVIDTK